MRYIFRSRVQLENESIDQFITDVKVKAKSCNFSTLNDGIIRDHILIGVSDNKLKERLLREADLDLVKTEPMGLKTKFMSLSGTAIIHTVG